MRDIGRVLPDWRTCGISISPEIGFMHGRFETLSDPSRNRAF